MYTFYIVENMTCPCGNMAGLEGNLLGGTTLALIRLKYDSIRLLSTSLPTRMVGNPTGYDVYLFTEGYKDM